LAKPATAANPLAAGQPMSISAFATPRLASSWKDGVSAGEDFTLWLTSIDYDFAPLKCIAYLSLWLIGLAGQRVFSALWPAVLPHPGCSCVYFTHWLNKVVARMNYARLLGIQLFGSLAA